jgi:hypothetical protein
MTRILAVDACRCRWLPVATGDRYVVDRAIQTIPGTNLETVQALDQVINRLTCNNVVAGAVFEFTT